MSQRFQPKPQRKLASFALEDETIAEKDVARKIGIVSWYVWQYLLKQSARGPKEIADAVNFKRDSVRRALKVLKHDNVALGLLGIIGLTAHDLAEWKVKQEGKRK